MRAPSARSQWVADVVDTDHHRVRHLARSWRPALVTHVADDDRAAVTDVELRAVVLADPYSFDEPECGAEPGDRLPHVRIDEDWDDDGGRDEAVAFQAAKPRPNLGDAAERAGRDASCSA